MNADWIRLFNDWRVELQKPIEINVEQIIGGGQALTRVNDTNVTATLTGTPATALLKAVTLTLGWTGTLALSRGGTAADLSATGGTAQYLKQASVGAAITVGTIPASDIASPGALTRTNDTNVTLTLGGSPTVALLAATSLTLGWTGTLAATRGGTGFGSYAVGDLLYADTTTTLAKLADVSAGSYLRSGGVTTAPVWSTLKLPNAATTGDLLYASAANTLIVRAIGSSADVLTVTGGVPVWAAPAAAGTSVIVDDTTTNATMFPTWVTASSGSLPLKVTSTKLTFNPSTGVLALATALPVTSGGVGINSYAVGDLLYASAATTLSKLAAVATGSVLLSAGVTTAPVWNNRINLGTNTFAKAALGAGALALDNGTTASPGVHFYRAANDNWGFANIGNAMTFVKNLNESGGIIRMTLDNNGLLTLAFPGPAILRLSDTVVGAGAFDIYSSVVSAVSTLLFSNTSANLMALTTGGNFGIGTTTPTAVLNLKAGTTAASSAPLKFTSGANLTTAEAGAMEYNGTNLFFTRAGTVRENVLVAVDNAAAPTTSIGVAIVNFYGANATNFLGDPNRWASINILGTVYKIPLYT